MLILPWFIHLFINVADVTVVLIHYFTWPCSISIYYYTAVTFMNDGGGG